MSNSKTILLTGASRGIGAAIAEHLKALGHNVIGQATQNNKGLISANFSQPDAPEKLWQTALERSDGHIDVLINNAGLFTPNPIDRDADTWRTAWVETQHINLTASAILCRAAILHWQAGQSSGRIVNIASRAAYRGDGPDHWHYAAAKGGMVAMTKTIARAYAAQQIYAFAICPGFTMTGMAEDYLESRGGEGLLADIPLGRVAEPEEIAKMTGFCALDAPASMTGAVLDANGASYVR